MKENEVVSRSYSKRPELHESLGSLNKFLNMAIVNLNSDYSFASNKFLKLTLDELYELDSILEQIPTESAKTGFDSGKLENTIKKSIIELKQVLPNDQTAFVKENKKKASTIKSNEQKETTDSTLSSTPNILNDWILSDFNLLSNDFNNELSLISGTLFELNFNYKLYKVLSPNCMLVKQRQATTGQPVKQFGNQKFVLKRLQKSSNPSVTKRSIVPFGKNVPFMCQLIKYYENDSTIFLLLEYHPFGRLFSYLDYLAENGSAFLKNLNEFQKELKKYQQLKHTSSDQHRRLSFSLEHYKAFRGESVDQDDVHRRRSKSLRTAQMNANSSLSNEQNSQTKSLLTEILLDQIEFIDDLNENKEAFCSNKSFSSSSSGLSSSTNSISGEKKNAIKEVENQIEFPSLEQRQQKAQQKEELNTTKWSKKILSNPFKTLFNSSKNKDNLIASFKSTPNLGTNNNANKQTDVHLNIKEEHKHESDPYFVQIRLWLAQLLLAIRGLHELGIVCQDLRPDNLLLSVKGQLCLTYTSRWNLVDELLSKDSIINYYCAPGN
jgi:hypothetical protein